MSCEQRSHLKTSEVGDWDVLFARVAIAGEVLKRILCRHRVVGENRDRKT